MNGHHFASAATIISGGSAVLAWVSTAMQIGASFVAIVSGIAATVYWIRMARKAK